MLDGLIQGLREAIAARPEDAAAEPSDRGPGPAAPADATPAAQGEANLAVNAGDAEVTVQAEPRDPNASPEDAHTNDAHIDIAALVEFLQDIAATNGGVLPPEVIEALDEWIESGALSVSSGGSNANLILAALPNGAEPVPDQPEGLLEWLLNQLEQPGLLGEAEDDEDEDSDVQESAWLDLPDDIGQPGIDQLFNLATRGGADADGQNDGDPTNLGDTSDTAGSDQQPNDLTSLSLEDLMAVPINGGDALAFDESNPGGADQAAIEAIPSAVDGPAFSDNGGGAAGSFDVAAATPADFAQLPNDLTTLDLTQLMDVPVGGGATQDFAGPDPLDADRATSAAADPVPGSDTGTAPAGDTGPASQGTTLATAAVADAGQGSDSTANGGDSIAASAQTNGPSSQPGQTTSGNGPSQNFAAASNPVGEPGSQAAGPGAQTPGSTGAQTSGSNGAQTSGSDGAQNSGSNGAQTSGSNGAQNSGPNGAQTSGSKGSSAKGPGNNGKTGGNGGAGKSPSSANSPGADSLPSNLTGLSLAQLMNVPVSGTSFDDGTQSDGADSARIGAGGNGSEPTTGGNGNIIPRGGSTVSFVKPDKASNGGSRNQSKALKSDPDDPLSSTDDSQPKNPQEVTIFSGGNPRPR